MHPNPSAYAGTTSAAIRPAKPSRYARIYTAPTPVILSPNNVSVFATTPCRGLSLSRR